MKVIECKSVDHTDNKNITFIRIDPENLQGAMRHCQPEDAYGEMSILWA